MKSHLLYFYGEGCPACEDLYPKIERLEKEENLIFQKLEVWSNDENEKLLEEIDCDLCGGVPFLYNTQNKKWLCGDVEYEELKTWSQN